MSIFALPKGRGPSPFGAHGAPWESESAWTFSPEECRCTHDPQGAELCGSRPWRQTEHRHRHRWGQPDTGSLPEPGAQGPGTLCLAGSSLRKNVSAAWELIRAVTELCSRPPPPSTPFLPKQPWGRPPWGCWQLTNQCPEVERMVRGPL